MTVVSIRGTSGAGKTWVARRVMDRIRKWLPAFAPGRRQPLYYVSVEFPRVVVLGHYNSPCGGADSVGSARQVYELICRVLGEERPDHVLYEGLLASEDVKWSALTPGLRCVFLTTPLDTCIRQVEGRRAAAGNAEPLNPTNTTRRVGVIERARTKLLDAGVPCRRAPAAQAAGLVLDWLGWS